MDIAIKVSVKSIIINIALFIFKLAAGILASSSAMISDAVHSASDILSTIIVIAGIRISGKSTDDGHPYGHERLECVAAILLAVLLFATGIGIGYSGVKKVILGIEGDLAVPRVLALIAAVVSIVVKEWMYRFTRSVAKKVNSGALMADAWHHRSDAMSSVGSLIGIGGAMLGFPILDPIAAIVICLFIIKASLNIFMDSVNKMVDKACDEETVERMRALVLSHENVHSLDLIKTRLFGNMIYVDIEIGVDKETSLSIAHDIAEEVHDAIEQNFENVKHCMVHVNPKESAPHNADPPC